MIRFASDADGCGNKGIIAVTNENHEVTSIANLIHPPLTLVDLEASDYTSGTLLLKVLFKVNSQIQMSTTIDDRWKIAVLYFES